MPAADVGFRSKLQWSTLLSGCFLGLTLGILLGCVIGGPTALVTYGSILVRLLCGAGGLSLVHLT